LKVEGARKLEEGLKFEAAIGRGLDTFKGTVIKTK
jgi:hypothetical protein